LSSAVPAEIADSDHVSDVAVLVNESIRLHCAAGGLPRPRVVWYFDDTPLTADIVDHAATPAAVQLLDEGRTLYVDSAQLRHAGRYTCRAVNVAGHDEKLFNLTAHGLTAVILH